MGACLAHERKGRVVALLFGLAGVRTRALNDRHWQILDAADAAFGPLAGVGQGYRVVFLPQRDKKALRGLAWQRVALTANTGRRLIIDQKLIIAGDIDAAISQFHVPRITVEQRCLKPEPGRPKKLRVFF